jgi:hypothetical protein
MNQKLLFVSILAIVAAFGMSAIAIGLANSEASALQTVSNKNQAGGNTQKGLVNVGNAQVDVGANVCAIATNC